MCPVWSLFAACLLASVVIGCASRGPRSPKGPQQAPQNPIPTRVTLQEVDDHPRISLVERIGDPSPAMAMAIAHDLGSVASVCLAALLEARLGKREGLGSRPHDLGLELHSLVSSPGEAAEFVRAAATALATPVQPAEPGVTLALERLRALKVRTWSTSVEARLASCSGELGVAPGTRQLERSNAELVPLLESWRKEVFSAASVAFAALGSAELLKTAADALAETRAWTGRPALRDPWPSGDFVGAEDSPGSRRLSVALRVENGAAAVEAARQLGQKSSGLATRLGALPADWKVIRVVGTTRARGGCLRLDLESGSRDIPPALDEIAKAGLLALDEAQAALTDPPSSVWTLEQSVLEAIDPREAAGVAAWRTLGGRLKPGHRAISVGLLGPGADGAMAHDLERKLAQLRSSLQKSTVEVVSRVEPGQGEVWLLLASPCGTREESSSTAGALALMLRAVAERNASLGTVSLEPWITPDGVGLLAHGPRLGPDETAEALAQRIASALGRSLVGTVLNGTDVAAARARLLGEIGPEPKPAYWQALELAAPGRISWLEPQGSGQSIAELAADTIESRRRAFLSGPLRLGVLANWNEQQVAAAQAGLERWLGGLKTAAGHCSPLPAPAPKSGLLALDAKERSLGVAAYMVVPISGGLANARSEAEWTTYILGRPRGPLERALGPLGGMAATEVRLLGGRQTAALVFEVRTSDDQAEAAVTALRGLFDRLGRSGVETRDFEAAQHALGRWQIESHLDPRRRLVDLWQAARGADPDSASLRRFQQRTFGSAPIGVVMVRSKD